MPLRRGRTGFSWPILVARSSVQTPGIGTAGLIGRSCSGQASTGFTVRGVLPIPLPTTLDRAGLAVVQTRRAGAFGIVSTRIRRAMLSSGLG